MLFATALISFWAVRSWAIPRRSQRYESLDNVTPAEVYNGRRQEILTARQRLKVQTLRRRACYDRRETLREEELIKPSSIRECVH